MIFPEVYSHTPDSFEDFRGELYTVFKKEDSDLEFNHDKVSISRQNVLRGLHGDSKSWKLVTCVFGEIQQVVVDLRESSPTYLKWQDFIINSNNQQLILIPPCFGNAYYVISQQAVYHYKLAYHGDYIDADEQYSIKWNDEKINIKRLSNSPELSGRDK